jgi:hypothetical protein
MFDMISVEGKYSGAPGYVCTLYTKKISNSKKGKKMSESFLKSKMIKYCTV